MKRRTVQTFQPFAANGSLTFPARDQPYRILAVFVEAAVATADMRPRLSMLHGNVCYAYRVTTALANPGLLASWTFAPNVSHFHDLHVAALDALYSIPDIIVHPSDRIVLEARGDAADSISAVTLVTDEL